MQLAKRFTNRGLIPLDQYPLRPERKKGESVLGWVHRFFALNGAEPDPFVAYLISRVYGSRRNGNDCKIRLIRAFGRLGGDGVAFSFGELAGMQYCPACLLEWPFHQQLWDYKEIQACPRHECELVQGCPHCGRDLSGFALINDFVCECGKSMVDVRLVKTHRIFADFSRDFAAVQNIFLPYLCDQSGSEQDQERLFDWRESIRQVLRVRYRMVQGRAPHYEYLNSVRHFPKLSYREMRFAGYSPEKVAGLLDRARCRCDPRDYSSWLTNVCYAISSEMFRNFYPLARSLNMQPERTV